MNERTSEPFSELCEPFKMNRKHWLSSSQLFTGVYETVFQAMASPRLTGLVTYGGVALVYLLAFLSASFDPPSPSSSERSGDPFLNVSVAPVLATQRSISSQPRSKFRNLFSVPEGLSLGGSSLARLCELG